MGQTDAGGSGDTLRECPFCGEAVRMQVSYIKSDGIHEFRVACPNMCFYGRPEMSRSMAIAAWNCRNPDWRQLAQELAAALDDACLHYKDTDVLLAKARAAGLEV